MTSLLYEILSAWGREITQERGMGTTEIKPISEAIMAEYNEWSLNRQKTSNSHAFVGMVRERTRATRLEF